MANLLLNSGNPVAGLGTSTYTVVAAGEYTIGVRSTIPRDPGGSSRSSDQTFPYASALQIVINKNGSPLVTVGGASTNPTPTQPSLAASTSVLCAAADVLTVVLSSANAVDALPNSVKSTITIFQGQ